MSELYEELIAEIQDKFNSLEIDRIMSCFSDDVIVHYNDLEPIVGKHALREFLSKRYSGIRDYLVTKKIRQQTGPVLTVEVRACYTKNNRNFKVKIFEILQITNRKISEWDYVGFASEN